ncbi:hypothetical protein D9613_001309 [Agrocybe pediades]|uniref:DUF6699 domain-containing protein n=1 Tax=Agrocybe pediades TaxID=84607 RepID=A0A8H4R7Q0_9AGAR|nr:hypothetical protein D9613_001309 [Agrocybe pediades]
MGSTNPTRKVVRFDLNDKQVGLEDDDEEIVPPRRTTVYRSPPPPTPSPTFSELTDSTTGPFTPPSPFQTVSSHSKDREIPPPLSLPLPAIPKINPALSEFAALMRWNMDDDPSKVIMRHELHGTIDEAASLPPGVYLTRMRIVHSAIPDWPLTVEKDSDEECLSVKQILFEIHRHMLKMVTGEHVKAQTPSEQEKIYESYKHRLTRPGSVEGIRRLDYLSNKTFTGLHALHYDEEDDVWVFSHNTAHRML